MATIEMTPQSRDAINASPYIFRLSAQDYLECFDDYKEPRRGSAVPYFLCCRSIELSLKALHLLKQSREEVKENYGHNLANSYEELVEKQKILEDDELALLRDASDIYKPKGFEYIDVLDVLKSNARFPDLSKLRALAGKLLNSIPENLF